MQSNFLQWALPLSCTVLFYGLAGGLWKSAELSPAQFCLLMVIVKTVLNWGTWAVRRPPIRLNAFLRFTLLGQLFNGVAWIFYFKSFESGPAAIVQTITAAYTALAAVLALIFLKERLVAIQMVGVGLVIAATLMLGGNLQSGDSRLEAWFFYSLITLLCWGISVVVFKHAYHQEDSNDTIFFVGNWVGMGLTLLPFGLFHHATVPALGLGWLVVLLYAIGDLTLFAAIGRGPAAIVSPLSGLYPIPTLIYAAAVLHETIQPIQWAATAMVLVAIVLVVPADENPLRLWWKGRSLR